MNNKGYRLLSRPDILSSVEIQDYIGTKYIAREVDYFRTIDSTNTYAKSIAKTAKEGRMIVAEEQTGGRGRLGRAWRSSEGKGIYFSLILKPELSLDKLPKLTLLGASSVILGLARMGIDGEIKWPNDIILKGKKICGILTEMTGELNSLDYIVMGIGINVNNSREDFQDGLAEKASSIYIESGKIVDRKKLLGSILNAFEELYDEYVEEDKFARVLEIAREKSALLGREIKVVKGEDEHIARALDINSRGELVVEYPNGERENINSGEVSIRGREGYI